MGFHDYSNITSADFEGTKVLGVDSSPISMKNYFLVYHRSEKWSIVKTEGHGFALERIFVVNQNSTFSANLSCVEAIRDLVVIAKGSRVDVYRLDYAFLERTKFVVLQSEEALKKVQSFELSLEDGEEIQRVKLMEVNGSGNRKKSILCVLKINQKIKVFMSIEQRISQRSIKGDSLGVEGAVLNDLNGAGVVLLSQFQKVFETVLAGVITDFELIQDPKGINKKYIDAFSGTDDQVKAQNDLDKDLTHFGENVKNGHHPDDLGGIEDPSDGLSTFHGPISLRFILYSSNSLYMQKIEFCQPGEFALHLKTLTDTEDLIGSGGEAGDRSDMDKSSIKCFSEKEGVYGLGLRFEKKKNNIRYCDATRAGIKHIFIHITDKKVKIFNFSV